MAVPFALPEDEMSNLIAAVIFLLSQVRIRGGSRELQECTEVLARLLAEELQRRSRSVEYDQQLMKTLLLVRQLLRKMDRASFESCCDDCKMNFHEECVKECGLKGDKEDPQEVLQKNEELLKESFFSRLVVRVRRTFWTAMPLICIVGLHLFQISYFM